MTNAGNDFSGDTVSLTNNIDLQGIEWTPIGNFYNSFDGTFDGGGFAVKNLKVSANPNNPNNEANGDQRDRSIGLIGYARGCTVKNLKIENCDVSGRYALGAVIGESEGSTLFENVEIVSGSVVANQDVGSTIAQVAGGFLGQGNGDDNNSSEIVFKNCKSYADVTVNKWHAGGLWGSITNANNVNVTIENCGNYGTITSRSINDGGYAGGFGGYFAAKTLTITGSVNEGRVSAAKYQGNLVGYSTNVGGPIDSDTDNDVSLITIAAAAVTGAGDQSFEHQNTDDSGNPTDKVTYTYTLIEMPDITITDDIKFGLSDYTQANNVVVKLGSGESVYYIVIGNWKFTIDYVVDFKLTDSNSMALPNLE